MSHRAKAFAAAAVALVAVLGVVVACDPDDVPTPGPSNVDVNTPELVKAKQAAGVEDCQPGTGSAVEGGLPDVTLPCFGGGPDVDLASLRGPMVVNLWGSWCGPCRHEMPVLAKFYAAHGDQVPMLGIDYSDVQTGAAMELVADSKVSYPLVADVGGELAAHPPFNPRMGLPISVFVDADGTATVVPGEIETEQELVDLVEEHLGVRL
jgi:thiol-disulfide isomerase/thioredoxin